MQITNVHDLPQAFVDFAQQDYIVAPYEYRVTSLLKGVRETILLRRHHDEIVVDVADMVWLLLGTAVHHMLETQKESETELKEERLKVEVPIGSETYILSGQFDLYCAEKELLTDYKTASVWKIVYKDFKDWRRQLLAYAWMLGEYGFHVKQARAIPFLKDHSKSKAKYDSNYPNLPVQKVEFNFNAHDYETVEEWVKQRFIDISAAEKCSDQDLPVCTPEERWYDGDTFAVMKKNRKSALRVLPTLEEAEKWSADNDKGEWVEKRIGVNKKCDDYCYVAPFCNWYQNFIKEANDGGEAHIITKTQPS